MVSPLHARSKRSSGRSSWPWWALVLFGAALAMPVLGGCATRGITTRALESRPIVRCYERNCSAAEDSRAAAQGGCPSCVY